MIESLEHMSREALIERLKQQETELCALRQKLNSLAYTVPPEQDAVCEAIRRKTQEECRIMEAEAKRRCEALERATAAKCRTYWDALAQSIASYPPLQDLSRELHPLGDDESTFGIDD